MHLHPLFHACISEEVINLVNGFQTYFGEDAEYAILGKISQDAIVL